jgi:glycerol-3-phosphate dehydrogenase
LISILFRYSVYRNKIANKTQALGTAPVLDQCFDIAIVGGGINGCGIARDAAGRGWSVILCEKSDLAAGTSSWSTKLIHGGLRYLENYEFRLVREALGEREVLWSIAPHIIRPLRFVLPYRKGLRPAWMLRLGLFLYDHIGGRKKLPGTRTLDLTTDPAGLPLHPGKFRLAFEYSDCRVDDARLVVLNARDAADRGAEICCRTEVEGAERSSGVWTLQLRDVNSGERRTVRARTIVNAAGPWVEDVRSRCAGLPARAHTRLVQGSHIVVRRLFNHDRAYILQNPDNRIVFAIPYDRDFTLIGTTDHDFEGDPNAPTATPEEIDYLCRTVSESFEHPIDAKDVIWSYAGVRPLYDDGTSDAKAATRDYVLELDARSDAPAVVSIFGGKITTYRRLAEEVIDRLVPFLPPGIQAKAWTANAPLPGGDFAVEGINELEQQIARTYPFLAADHVSRLVAAYGTQVTSVLGPVADQRSLGHDFGASLSEAEVRYLVAREWAQTAEDIVWRRTKLGLRLTPQQIQALGQWLAESPGGQKARQELRAAP